jgi:hypothetical protein
MAAKLRELARWSIKPARNVATATTPSINVVRGLAARATTPLLPDDYLKFLNPLWSARELRGEIVDVRSETEDSATVVIKPGWGFSADYQPGQYVGIGLSVDGRWHWRSYSLTSVPRRDNKHITITVKATPEGFPEQSFAWLPPRATSRYLTRHRRKYCSSARVAVLLRLSQCCVRSGNAARDPTLCTSTRLRQWIR